MRRWHGVVESYLRCEEARGLASSTLEMKYKEFLKFGNWLCRRKPRPRIEDISGEHIIEYIKSRSAFRARVTVYRLVSELRGFGEYLFTEGLWVENPLRWIKGPKVDPRRNLPYRINKAHHVKIWEALCSHGDKYQRVLWSLILSLLYGTGLRRGELIGLTVNDWDREQGLLKINGQKTGRYRHVPLPEIACQSMETYLPLRHNVLVTVGCEDEPQLLITKRGGPMGAAHISKRLKDVAKHAGIPHITMHQFRHSCASDLLSEGVGLCQIQRILGHAVITSTFRYTHVSDPERQKAIQLHPVNNMLSTQNGE